MRQVKEIDPNTIPNIDQLEKGMWVKFLYDAQHSPSSHKPYDKREGRVVSYNKHVPEAIIHFDNPINPFQMRVYNPAGYLEILSRLTKKITWNYHILVSMRDITTDLFIESPVEINSEATYFRFIQVAFEKFCNKFPDFLKTHPFVQTMTEVELHQAFVIETINLQQTRTQYVFEEKKDVYGS